MDRASHRGGLGRLSPRQRRRHPDAAQADRPRRPGTLSARRADAARRRLIVADSEDPQVDGGAAGDGAAARRAQGPRTDGDRSEEHTSELQSLMRISYAVFHLKTKTLM